MNSCCACLLDKPDAELRPLRGAKGVRYICEPCSAAIRIKLLAEIQSTPVQSDLHSLINRLSKAIEGGEKNEA